MAEEDTKEEDQEEGDEKDDMEIPDEDKKKTAHSIIQKTKDAAAELQKQNEIMEKHLVRAERLRAEEIISGRSAGGRPQVKEESPKEYAARVMRGDVSVKA